MDMRGKVRRLHICDKWSIARIAKQMGLPQNRIEKRLGASSHLVLEYERKPHGRQLTLHELSRRANGLGHGVSYVACVPCFMRSNSWVPSVHSRFIGLYSCLST